MNNVFSGGYKELVHDFWGFQEDWKMWVDKLPEGAEEFRHQPIMMLSDDSEPECGLWEHTGTDMHLVHLQFADFCIPMVTLSGDGGFNSLLILERDLEVITNKFPGSVWVENTASVI